MGNVLGQNVVENFIVDFIETLITLVRGIRNGAWTQAQIERNNNNVSSDIDTSLAEQINTDNTDVQDLDPVPELPEGVIDIDAGDRQNPLCGSGYINDIYRYLYEMEEKYPIAQDFISDQVHINATMRENLLDWLVDIQAQFTFVPDTFHITVAVIDRYLQAVTDIDPDQLPIVGITATYIALKYEEVNRIHVDVLLHMADNVCSKEDILLCERQILSKLDFCLARPIPLHFLRRFLTAANGCNEILCLAEYLIDLSLLKVTLAYYKPSELAASAICLSLYLVYNKPLKEAWTQTMVHYSGYTIDHIIPIIEKMGIRLIEVKLSKCKAVFNKYSGIQYQKVATMRYITTEVMYRILVGPSHSHD